LASPNAGTIRNGDILPLYAELKDLNISNAMDLIRSNTTVTLFSAVRKILKSTCLVSKQNKVNPVCTHSNV